MTKPTSVVLLTIACLFATVSTALATDRPNVIFISIDDLNDWIGCLQGHPQAKTPNIDRLAARGVLFANAHCASPACNPSRAAVFSGRMAYQTGVWSNRSPRLVHEHPELTLLPTAFKAAGYTTMGTGKLLHTKSSSEALYDHHFSPEQRWSPLAKDAVPYQKDELPSKGTKNPRHIATLPTGKQIVLPLNRMPSDRAPRDTKGESFDWGPMDVADSEMGDTKITNWAIEQLSAHQRVSVRQATSNRQDTFSNTAETIPFFLAVGYYRPHIPLWAPKKYFAPFAENEVSLPAFQANDLDDLSLTARKWAIDAVTAGSHATVIEHQQWPAATAAYLACVHFVDSQLGRLLDHLDASPFANNTVVVLWSDHGWHLGEKQHWGKWTGWERSTRVPLMVALPKNWSRRFAKANSVCQQPVSLLDLYPTLAELCNLSAPDGLDGESLTPLLRDPATQTDRSVVTTFDPGNVAIRTLDWRYIRYTDGSEELYDRRDDPHEWRNLANSAAHTERLSELRKRIPSRLTDQ